jgi:hypothetical protein
MFKIGDKVKILDAENRYYYKQILNKIGTIQSVVTYHDVHVNKTITKYYVEIPEFDNEYQDNGWWVFLHKSSLRLISDEVTCGDCMDAISYAMWGFDKNYIKVPIVKESLEDKGDNYMTILEIYKERRREKINKKYDDMENAVRQCDPRYKVWRECTNTLLKLYEEDKILANAFAPINLSDETRKRLNAIDKTRCEELHDLSDKLNEVQAQLSMCETYEQKQDILRTYKIIKENGKVNG